MRMSLLSRVEQGYHALHGAQASLLIRVDAKRGGSGA